MWLLRNPEAVTLTAPGRLQILVPPARLITVCEDDAGVALDLLERASASKIELPPDGTRSRRLVDMLVEEDVLQLVPPPVSVEAPDRRIRVLYGITGGIDAVYAPAYLQVLAAQGFDVQIAITEAAERFMRPQALRWLSGAPVAPTLFEGEGADHVSLGAWADVVAVVPATAEFICRLAAGGYTDLLSAAIAATTGSVILAPGTNLRIWQRRAVQRAITCLAEEGFHLVLPGAGVSVAVDKTLPRFGGVGVGPRELPALLRLVVEHGARLGETPATEAETAQV